MIEILEFSLCMSHVLLSEEFSSFGKLTHFMRYCSIPCWVLESSTASTSYSSPSSIIISGGVVNVDTSPCQRESKFVCPFSGFGYNWKGGILLEYSIPHNAFQKGRWVIEIIIDHAHTIIGHFSQFKTTQYIRRYFWQMSMTQDLEAFCMSCGACAVAKDANSKPKGLLHSLPILDRPWKCRIRANDISNSRWKSGLQV